MPSTGVPACTVSVNALSSSRALRLRMALPAAPTPGKITRSAARTRSGSFVMSARTPTSAQARCTLRRLPAS